MTALTNSQLSLLRKGNRKVFKNIYEQLFDAIYYYALTFVNEPEFAEELVQESFLMLWERRSYFTEGFNVKAYLFKSTHNQALNYIRHQKVVQKHLKDVSGTVQISQTQTHEPWLADALKTAIEQLPTRTKQIFIMSRIKEYRHKEIAEELSISEKTVEVQIRKARLTLQKKLKRYYKEI